jgi:dihydropteroate synthase
MGVLNITPDSFSDGGELFSGGVINADALCARAEAMLAGGAVMLDIGGESTRPGAAPVGEAEELDRVLGALQLLRARFDTIISVDTSTPRVMSEAAANGAGLINDVRALQRDGALAAAASTNLPVCLMHMQGEPDSMQRNPAYDDVVTDVMGFLKARVASCLREGIASDRLVLDPGFGFGKTLAHNFQLLAGLHQICSMGYPVLAGLSRKSMIAGVLERAPDERMPASIGLAVIAAQQGARLIRVHDVAETYDALAMVRAMEQFNS